LPLVVGVEENPEIGNAQRERMDVPCAKASKCPSPITPLVPSRFVQRRVLPRARLGHWTPS